MVVIIQFAELVMATDTRARASTVPVGGKRCVAGGPNRVSCGNSQHTKGISIHHFPRKVKDHEQHLLWVRFVRWHRPNLNPSDQSVLCGIHFDDASYTMRRDIALSLGMKVYLKPDAVPLIDVANMREEQVSLPLQAREKRQVRIPCCAHLSQLFSSFSSWSLRFTNYNIFYNIKNQAYL